MDPALEPEDDGLDDIPLQHQRHFGAGLARKEAVAFVPASDGALAVVGNPALLQAPSQSVGDLYLSMVLPKDKKKDEAAGKDGEPGPAATALCEVCKLPLTKQPPAADTAIATTDPEQDNTTAIGLSGEASRTARNAHFTSLAHQVCLAHSPPPSALDRSRMGLAVLQASGWDPDTRRGLGAAQQGIAHPVKATPKHDTRGLGAVVVEQPLWQAKQAQKVQKKTLDAKKTRQAVAAEQRRTEKLREQFFGNDDVERYLGRRHAG